MKKYKYLGIIAILAFSFSACKKDFLERLPESTIAPQVFFKTENDLILYTNSFYNDLPGATAVYSADLNSDNVEISGINSLLAGTTTIPENAASAGWTWGSLRNINFFLDNYNRAEVSPAIRNKYAGLARFFRAWFYFDKVKRFGGVPWYSASLNVSSPELFKARDPRTLVMDSIIADLDFASKNLDAGKSISRVTKWAALALKSRVCLFEGTFRKYHTELNLQSSASSFLTLSYQAADEIMKGGKYKLYTTGNPDKDYRTLFTAETGNADEFILAEVYESTLKTYPGNGTFLTATLGNPGLTKSLIDSYLLKDGTPFSSQPGYDTMMFAAEVKNRDPRLSQTIRTPGYTRMGTTKALIPDFSNALTGYQVIKYTTGTDQDGYNTNTNDLPVFRYAEVLLNYAEAKVESGGLTQADIDRSINLLRDRAGVARMKLGNMPNDAIHSRLYAHTSDPRIIEIRRERRVELAMEGFRYGDLLRWKEGRLLAETFKGMYFSRKGVFDLDGNGVNDFAIVDNKPAKPDPTIQYYVLGTSRTLSKGNSGNIIVHPTLTKIFKEERDYLFPLPATELLLNSKLTQNPGW